MYIVNPPAPVKEMVPPPDTNIDNIVINIDLDRALIKETAASVRNLWKEINAAEKFIAIGREFKSLREQLAKSSRHDKSRIGWCSAFNDPEGKFGCDRRTAERCIAIYEAFAHVGAIAPTWKLPQHLRTLASLAALKLPARALEKLLAEEKISPNSTAADVCSLGEALGLLKPKKPAAKKAAEPVSATIPNLAWAWTHESREKRRELLDAVGADEIRETMSPAMLKQFRDRFEHQRQLVEDEAHKKTKLKLVASA
jgi:hypothetical protein